MLFYDWIGIAFSAVLLVLAIISSCLAGSMRANTNDIIIDYYIRINRKYIRSSIWFLAAFYWLTLCSIFRQLLWSICVHTQLLGKIPKGFSYIRLSLCFAQSSILWQTHGIFLQLIVNAIFCLMKQFYVHEMDTIMILRGQHAREDTSACIE